MLAAPFGYSSASSINLLPDQRKDIFQVHLPYESRVWAAQWVGNEGVCILHYHFDKVHIRHCHSALKMEWFCLSLYKLADLKCFLRKFFPLHFKISNFAQNAHLVYEQGWVTVRVSGWCCRGMLSSVDGVSA